MVHQLSNKKRVHTQIATSDCGSRFRLPAEKPVASVSKPPSSSHDGISWQFIQQTVKVPHYKVGPEPIVTNGNSWGPYKWPKIHGFHWGEFTLLAHLVDLEQQNPPVIWFRIQNTWSSLSSTSTTHPSRPLRWTGPENAEPPSEHF